MTDPIGGLRVTSDQASSDGEDARYQTARDVSRAGMDYTPPVRTNAIRAAGRHTVRVKFLRRAIIVGAALSISVIGIIAMFDPFKHLPSHVSISGVGIKGTKITLQSPKLQGLQQGGGTYRIEAASSTQDITQPALIWLNGVDTHIDMADKTVTHVLSRHGIYDSALDRFHLDGDVKINSTSGYRFALQSAIVDFKAGTLTSQQRMRVDIQGGDINADALTIGESGHHLVFTGHVGSHFEAEEPSPQATAEVAPTPADPIEAALTEVKSIKAEPDATASTRAAREGVSR